MTADAYLPQDLLYLWWLGEPSLPRLVGEIALAGGGRKVSLRYAQSWLASGFALSEDLPLVDELFVPPDKDCAAGALDDARPDRWGERVIRRFTSAPRLSLLEFLLFAGDDRYGALGVSLRGDSYAPWRDAAPLPDLGNLAEMLEVVRKVLANEAVPEQQQRLVRPGASLGGARPKSLLWMDGEAWLVKFSEGEDIDTPLVEHATMTLARACGIDTAETRALPVGNGHAVAVRRFDRVAGGRGGKGGMGDVGRVGNVDDINGIGRDGRDGDVGSAGAIRKNAVSAHVALRAAGEAMGYPQLAQLLRRVAPAGQIAGQQAQLFRRMVFNILMDNTDDHEKNHALLRQQGGGYLLSPAFDVVPAAQGLGYQAMDVGARATEASLANALSEARQFGLKPGPARQVVREVCEAVAGWQPAFAAQGVTRRDIDQLAQYIDGDRLAGQRREFVGG